MATMDTTISRAYHPRVWVSCTPDVDNFVKSLDSNSFLDLLQSLGPQLDQITVRNTRAMSAKFNDFKVHFIDTPILAPLPTISESEEVLKEGKSYEEWFETILSETASALAPFETWSHPVAGVLAISSKTADPLDRLQELYDSSFEQFASLPFVNADFLRIFVVIHDEGDNWDKTLTLFEHVKQKFGSHSAVIRLGTSQPQQNLENLKQFKHEIMSKSVVPFMEECCAVWYDQMTTARQSLTGRLLSVSRKYAVSPSKLQINILETVSRKTQRFLKSPNTVLKHSYHADMGYYDYTSPLSQLRKIGDFAMMLRDYKFAHSVYDMIRKDINADKAWTYSASCQEMTCVTSLLISTAPLNPRDNIIDAFMDSSIYSYVSRAKLPLYALRDILQVSELLAQIPVENNASALHNLSTVYACRWIHKAMSERLTEQLGYAYLMERMANVYFLYNQQVEKPWSRKAAFWMLLAAREWEEAGYLNHASRCLKLVEPHFRNLKWAHEKDKLLGRLELAEASGA